MANVFVEEQCLQDIADAIRTKNGLTDKYKPKEMAGAINDLDIFWDIIGFNGTRLDWRYAFFGHWWTEERFRPKHDFYINDGSHMIRDTDIYNLKECLEKAGVNFYFVLDNTKAKPRAGAQSMFESSQIEAVPDFDLTNVENIQSMFRLCKRLKEVTLLNIQADTVLSNCFYGCDLLEKVTLTGVIGVNAFTVGNSPNMRHDSLINILNILEDKTADTSGTTWKITLGATNIAKLTENELNIAYKKGWSIA